MQNCLVRCFNFFLLSSNCIHVQQSFDNVKSTSFFLKQLKILDLLVVTIFLINKTLKCYFIIIFFTSISNCFVQKIFCCVFFCFCKLFKLFMESLLEIIVENLVFTFLFFLFFIFHLRHDSQIMLMVAGSYIFEAISDL